MPTAGCLALSKLAEKYPQKSDLPKKLQQFLIDCNGAAFTVGSLHCDITSAKEKGIDAEALTKHLAAHNLPQQASRTATPSRNLNIKTALQKTWAGTHCAQHATTWTSQI
jgi:hypothetical protein